MRTNHYRYILLGCLLAAGGWGWLRLSPQDHKEESGLAQAEGHQGAEEAELPTSGSLKVRQNAPDVPAVEAKTPPQAEKGDPSGVRAPSLWQRLKNPVVLESEDQVLADGRVLRSKLVRVEGKYEQIVFRGILPAGDQNASDDALRNTAAMVADHLLVHPSAGMSAEDFRNKVEEAGGQLGKQLSPNGAYVVKLPQASIHGVEKAVEALQLRGIAAIAEPDYLVHATDIPGADRAVELVNGVAVYPDSNLDANTVPVPQGPVLDQATQAADIEQRLQNAPAGARIITFDAPSFPDGAGYYNPYIETQNFIISTDGGVYIQGAEAPGYPNNGTFYMRSALGEGNLTIRHAQGVPFSIQSVDLAEYSGLFATGKAVTFTGTKSNGTTVSQTFGLDGIIDGTGPIQDFQTFTFGPQFTDLTRIVVWTNGYMLDNPVVIVEGQESPPPVPPLLPLCNDITFDSPKHQLDQQVNVSGPFAPASVNFGTPMVRSQIGLMQGPALELKGAGYQQVNTMAGRFASSYRLELDAYLDLPNTFTIHFDGADTSGNPQALYFDANGTISTLQDNAMSGTLGNYPVRQLIKIAVNVDIAASQWEVFVDGISKFKRPFVTTNGDLRAIRFHAANTGSGSVGIDNVRLYAYGVGETLAPGPRLVTSSGSLAFPMLTVGSSMPRYLNVRNTGSQPLEITSVSSDNSVFQVQANAPITILPGGETNVTVKYLAQAPGSHSGSLTIVSNDANHSPLVIPLSGSTQAAPALVLSPLTLDVTMLANRVGTETFHISNAGNASLNWNLVLKGLATQPGSPTDPARTPNDNQFSSLWAMKNASTNQGGIDAVHAWSVTTGHPSNVIAVIDTGVDRTHPDLQGNLWVNTGEVAGNGIDDDHNGFVDDVHGWDFANDDADPSDGHGHGTHVAGTIAARGDNALGVTGVCWDARVMAVKFLPDSGAGYTSDAIGAISYATRMGAKISNNSWGGGGYSQTLQLVIQEAGQADSLFVAAAGNDARDNDQVRQYPSGYPLDNIIAVASTNENDWLSYFSNYGAESVDVAAPGSNILSLRPGGQYKISSGTSMAAPHVTGVAGLLLAKNPTLSVAQLKQLLMFGSDALPSVGNQVASQGRINAYKTLKATVPKWLRPQITSGSVLAGQSKPVPLTVDTSSLAPGTYQQTIALSSNDPLRPQVDLPVILKVIENTGYHQWLQDSFTSNNMLANATESATWSDGADPDGDGVSNLLEYLTGNDSRVINPQGIVSVQQVNGENAYEFRVKESLADVNYRVEWTDDLTSSQWRTDRLSVLSNTTTGMPQDVHRVRVKITGNQPGKAFFRLVATRIP